MMRQTGYKKGFTLAELLIALMVTSIILAAVATLAFAMGSANDTGDDISAKQAQVRYATLRICELIRHGASICATPDNGVAIWRADDNGDGWLNLNELVYIESGPGASCLQLCQFNSTALIVDVNSLNLLSYKSWLKSNYDETYTIMIPQCENVTFFTHGVSPPSTTRLSISFDLAENSLLHKYQISATKRSGQ
ncbi:MAG: PilW family protein [Planctomycetota bacterium]|jgi:prepilin-type N-terminal cleavage/methylation domain-containing protein